MGKSWIAAADLDSAGPQPLDPLSHAKRHAGEGLSPALLCYKNVRRNASFVYFSHPALMTAPSPIFRRGDQGVRSSGAVDSPDFQKNTCARDGYYAFTHTKLRRANKYSVSIIVGIYYYRFRYHWIYSRVSDKFGVPPSWDGFGGRCKAN